MVKKRQKKRKSIRFIIFLTHRSSSILNKKKSISIGKK